MKKSLLFALMILLGITGYAMMFEIGGGYRFAPGNTDHHGFNLDTGIFNDFNDIIELDVTYHPEFDYEATSTGASSPTNYWNFDFDAMIPLLGRQEDIRGYRFGLFATFEFGNFYSDYKYNSGTAQSNAEAWGESDYWFGSGVYGQYFLDPWMFELSLGFPIINSYDEQEPLDQLLGSFEFKGRYFVKSDIHDFKDHLVLEFQVSTRKIGLSVVLLEPF